MKNRKQILMENILNYLKEQVEATKDCCGVDDDINYLPAKKAFDAMTELKGLIEVTT